MWPFRSNGSQSQEEEEQRRPLISPSPSPDQVLSRQEHSPGTVHDRNAEPTPVPIVQLSVLLVMRVVEPLSFTLIFPFVTEQLQRNMPNVPHSQIGYYVGLIESVFALVQMFTVFFWGRLSDSIGRKPVLIMGMIGVAISTLCFGLSKTLTSMILARSVSGLMNGNVAVLKSVLGEITDDSNQARCFVLLPVSFAIGSIIGPSLGGSLSDPVQSFPSLFGKSKFFAEFPYFLPCLIAAIINLCAIVFGMFFLKETLPSKVREEAAKRNREELEDAREVGPSTSTSSGSATPTLQHRLSEPDLQEATLKRAAAKAAAKRLREEAEDEEEARISNQEIQDRPSIKSLLTPQIISVLTTQMMNNLMNISYSAIMPLFCYSTVENGGLGWSKQDIGYILGVNGMAGLIVQLIIFPRLEKRLGGPLFVYRRVLMALPLTFSMFPLAHWTQIHYGRQVTWIVMILMVVFKSTGNMGLVCATLLVNNSAPSKASLGSLNGLSQTCGSFSRFIGPFSSTSLFAFSISIHFLNGQLIWIFMIALALFTWSLAFKVKVNKPAWRKKGTEGHLAQSQRIGIGNGNGNGNGTR